MHKQVTLVLAIILQVKISDYVASYIVSKNIKYIFNTAIDMGSQQHLIIWSVAS